MMKIIEKERGSVEFVESMNPRFQQMFGRDTSVLELRFLPFLMYSLTDQYMEREKIRKGERELLKEYQSKGFIVKNGTDIGCTKEFWNFISSIVYDSYVQELSRADKS